MAASEPGTVLLQQAESGLHPGRRMLFRRPEMVIEVRQPAKIIEAFAAVEEALANGFFVAGFVGYEAGFAMESSLACLCAESPEGEPLIWLGCYRSPEINDELISTASGSPCTPQSNLTSVLSFDQYKRSIETIRNLIAAGETYQANFTFDVQWRTPENPAEMFSRLLRVQPVRHAALLHAVPGWHVLSLSPELFFARDGQRIITRPMKGTASPGADAIEARSNAAWLRADEKNRAENVMIVDLLRNDLGRICQMGSVKMTNLFEIERYPTVLQMTSTVEGRLRGGIGYLELFKALFPSGSVVGAPKIHTMRLLHALENRARGVYTGAIGYIAPDRKAEFSVAIRTISLRGDQARMGVGSGIVYDSVPAQEYAECQTKLEFLTREPLEDFQLIETLLLRRGAYDLLNEHLERMAQSAEYFEMVFNDDWVRAALGDASRAFLQEERMRIRLLLSREGKVTWVASPVKTGDVGELALLMARSQTDPRDVFLRHKTTRRLHYDDAFSDAEANGYADALFRNVHDEITEGAIHNVIVSIDGRRFTPPLTCGVLPGVYRRWLLEQGQLSEQVIRVDDLLAAEAVYICNSVRGLRRIKCIRQRSGNSNAFETIWKDAGQDAYEECAEPFESDRLCK